MPIAFVIAFATLGEGLPRQTFICSTRMTLQEPIALLVLGSIPKASSGLCRLLLSSRAAVRQPSAVSTMLTDVGAALTRPKQALCRIQVHRQSAPGLCRTLYP